MTRSNARELAVHLIYSRSFTGEEPETALEARLDKAYYAALSQENEVYAERPSRKQLAYLDQVVVGTANRAQELDETIQRYSIGWDLSRISRLTRAILQLALFECSGWRMYLWALRSTRRSPWRRSTTAMTPVPLSTAFSAPSSGGRSRLGRKHPLRKKPPRRRLRHDRPGL